MARLLEFFVSLPIPFTSVFFFFRSDKSKAKEEKVEKRVPLSLEEMIAKRQAEQEALAKVRRENNSHRNQLRFS